jgi:HEPN domain-containing protein
VTNGKKRLAPTDAAVNDFALRSFRDIADGDYIAARMACRAFLLPQFLWASQQALEKYLKCILLLHRIDGKKVRHDLGVGVSLLDDNSSRLEFELTKLSREFIARIDEMGWDRYLEVSHWGEAAWVVSLDRAVWELRRFCTLQSGPRRVTFAEGRTPKRIQLQGGYLERVLDHQEGDWARRMLVWQNAFFGPRIRRLVRPGGWIRSTNAPLPLRPEIFPEVDKYVFLSKPVRQHWLKALSGAKDADA